jgi:hypothetical protein
MDAAVPEGWVQDSQTLYLHESGVRIERRVYRQKEGWVLVPVELDKKVLEFAPNTEGLEQAFAAFGAETRKKGPTSTTAGYKAARSDESNDAATDAEEKDDEDDDGTE